MEDSSQIKSGKNKRQQLDAYDEVHKIALKVDSNEEFEFIDWLNEAFELGIIIDFNYQHESFTLSVPKTYIDTKHKSRCLFREHVYSPDFTLDVDVTKFPSLLDCFKVGKDTPDMKILRFYIDVKGEFARNGGGRSFSINQKWMYEANGIYVYKLVPKAFFKKFGFLDS